MADSSQKVDLTKQARAKRKDSSVRSGPTMGALIGGEVVRGVEQILWLYEIICSLYEWGGIGAWRRSLVASARGRVLDLGSGTGRNLPLLPHGTKAVGLDLSLDALRRARRRAPAVPLVIGRAEALPFRAATFDTVLSGLVFCSVGDPRRGLEEVKRVLRPDGELRMLEHVRSRIPWRARLQDFIQPIWTWTAGGCHPRGPWRPRDSRSSPRDDEQKGRIVSSPPAKPARRHEGIEPSLMLCAWSRLSFAPARDANRC